MKTRDAQYWIALNAVFGMTPKTFYDAVAHFGDPAGVWTASDESLASSGVFTPEMLRKLLDARAAGNGEQEMERAFSAGIRIITLYGGAYPPALRETHFPPPVIYVLGELKAISKRGVAIVGSRQCTGYGKTVAHDLAAGLSKAGFNVTSGFARGIDTAAHTGSVEAGGTTAAILATGQFPKPYYPAGHEKLAESILATGGALVSEYPVGTGAEKWKFPRRNRIISGLSEGVIIVEAGEKSGAMVTADIASEQSRQVFAVPGDITRELSKGPHSLIKLGATLVETAEDVVGVLGRPESPAQKELEFDAPPETLPDATDSAIVEIVKRSPASFDEIAAATALPASQLASRLLMLELRGAIRQMPGRIFVTTAR